MVAVPAWVWRFNRVVRALIVGLAFGVVLGLLAMISSNSVLSGSVAIVVITLVFAFYMDRRISKFWPGAGDLSGTDRVAVARAVRGGHDVGDARLAPAVIDYSRGLHDAAEGKLGRWLIAVLGVVALAVAIADTIFSPPGEAIVSWLYFAFFPVEAFLWPRRVERLLANAERAEESATRLLAEGV